MADGGDAGRGEGRGRGPWLVVIDPQVVFADPASEWGSPFFPAAFARIREMAAEFEGRVLVTRWLPTADRATSWGEYFKAWPFADKAPDDRMFDLVDGAEGLSQYPCVDVATFGKWGPKLRRALADGCGIAAGPDGDVPVAELPPIVLAGVSTDCCVVATALAAGDAGMRVTVAADACAGSTAENHAAALHVMGLFEPQVNIHHRKLSKKK
ncbi:cysteine hydrolase [Dermabacteraceae bacterium TAE3-ERU5]|nr:cysteine hydrolase [Dermabacteraceae bacterium TAE3-ERU5]